MLLNTQQTAKLSPINAEAEMIRQRAEILKIYMIGLALFILVMGGSEFNAIKNIFDYYNFANNPDEEIFQSWLLSFMSVGFIIGFHIMDRKYQDTVWLKIFKGSVWLFVIVYAIGMGLSVCASVYSMLGDMGVQSPQNGSLFEDLKTAANRQDGGMLKNLLLYLVEASGGILALGFSGLSLVGLLLSSIAISKIEEFWSEYQPARKYADGIKLTGQAIAATEKKHGETQAKLTKLKQDQAQYHPRFISLTMAKIQNHQSKIEGVLGNIEALPILSDPLCAHFEDEETQSLRLLKPEPLRLAIKSCEDLKNGGLEKILKFSGNAACAILVVFSLMATPEPVKAEGLTTVLDLSGSAPIHNDAFAQKAANTIYAIIKKMRFGDTVTIKTLGEVGLNNIEENSYLLSPQKKPKILAVEIAKWVMDADKHYPEPQQETNLIALFEQSAFNCKADNQHIYVLTDGIESSRDFTMSPNKLNKPFHLPQPPQDLLSGCTVTFDGIGRVKGGISNAQMKNLKAAWDEYFKIAGVKAFYPLN